MSRAGSKQSSSQFGKGLSYNASLPPFLQRLHAQAGDTSGRSGSASGSGSRGGSSRGVTGFDELDEDERPSVVEDGRGAVGGRASLPTRPKEGPWAEGSDDEDSKPGAGKRTRAGAAGEDEDEWDQTYGGGGDDGPQVVVLKEGKHMTQEEVDEAREQGVGKKRKRGEAETELPSFVNLPSTRASIADKSSSLASSLPASSPKSKPKSDQATPLARPTPSASAINNTAGAKRKLAELALEKERKRAQVANGAVGGTGRDVTDSKTGKESKEAAKREKGKKVLLSFGEGEEGDE